MSLCPLHENTHLKQIPCPPMAYLLSVTCEKSEDSEWILKKFYEHRHLFEELDHHYVGDMIAKEFDKIPPHPGYDASSTSNTKLMNSLFCDTSTMSKLEKKNKK